MLGIAQDVRNVKNLMANYSRIIEYGQVPGIL